MTVAISPEINPRTKRCTKCKIELPLSQFGVKKISLDGLNWWCKRCTNESYKDYYEKNNDSERIKKSQYFWDNRQKCLEYSREYLKKYWKTPHGKDKKRIIDAKRRAIKIGTTTEPITQYFLDNLLESQSYKCNICSCSIESRLDRHLDHIFPLCKGGAHTMNNLQWLCVKCNLSKGGRILTNQI